MPTLRRLAAHPAAIFVLLGIGAFCIALPVVGLVCCILVLGILLEPVLFDLDPMADDLVFDEFGLPLDNDAYYTETYCAQCYQITSDEPVAEGRE